MLLGLYIIVDDDVEDPVYAEPNPADLDDGVWEKVCETVEALIDGDADARGSTSVGEAVVAWRAMVKLGLTFVAVVSDDVKVSQIDAYLTKLAKRYVDEVDELRTPDRGGVADVVLDVVPPWEDDDD
ncbi:MAG: hypothetical protein R3F59_26570 [Myxococcota bacterium]